MNEQFYENSIILIGPSGAGKSIVGQELQDMTDMPRLSLDKLSNRAVGMGISQEFGSDEFKYHLILEALKIAEDYGKPGIVDFGAGHSVYDDFEIFERVKSVLLPFQNIVLLLPCQDEQRAIEIMENRSTGDTFENKKFFESSCNSELAAMIVYENGRQSVEVAEEIMDRIREKQELQLNQNAPALK